MAGKRKVFIETPRGKIVEVKHKDGKSTARLEWNPGFAPKLNKMFENVQEYVDSECIRRMTPYTPMQTGALYKSAILGTVIGSGEIVQVAPYARFQYYGKVMVDVNTGSAYADAFSRKKLTDKDLEYSTAKHQQAGAFWFERMKADDKDSILRGAKKYIERGNKV